jgi:hypothetical protein
MIATAEYLCPDSGQHATIVIYQGLKAYHVCAYLDSDDAHGPTWQERDLDLPNARCWGQLYHRKLKRDYHMQRVA